MVFSNEYSAFRSIAAFYDKCVELSIVAVVVESKLVSFIDDTGLLLVVCRCNDPLENVGSLLIFPAALVNSVFILSMRRSKPE